MDIFKFEDVKGQLLELMRKQSLVPVLGAGFTRNEKTKDNDFVPDAERFKSIMIEHLIKNEKLSELEEELKKLDFNKVSNYFFDNEFFPLQDRKAILRKYFLNVILPYNKKNFLNKDIWPYIYTFNIDDAIEANSLFRPVMPYKKLDMTARDAGCVYKIHGDVFHEITYEESSNLIFSEPQYIASLIKNQSMLNFLKSDLFDNNLMFIGCSLDNEIDLMYALSSNADEYNIGAKRILVTRILPKNALEEFNYKKHGINTIIHVDNYNDFYNSLISLMEEVEKEIEDNSNLYKISTVNKLNLDKDKNLEFLLQNKEFYVNTDKDEQLVHPYFTIERTIINRILESVNTNPITVIKGRRFSGKSYLSLNIAEKNKVKTFYYFPSTMKIDRNTLITLLQYKNSLIFFDSNVLDQELALLLKKSFEKLENNNTSVIVVCNNMEIDIANTFLSIDRYEYNFYYELYNKFDNDETQKINHKLSQMGIVAFKERITLLDNIYSLRVVYPNKLLDIAVDNITYEEAQLLIILSVFDKIYTPVCVALGIDRTGWTAFVNKFSPIVELVYTSFAEREQHSQYKIVVNSKIWLNKLLKNYHWQINQTEILNNIETIIKTFKGHGQYQLIQQRVMMLDSLNDIMGKEGGSYKLMNYIYTELQDLLADSPDYWLQRAKVIYKLEKYDIKKVEDAIDHAKKAYYDGNRLKTIHNAEFMVALLYAKLCIMQKFHNTDNILEAINWFHKAIETHETNREYVNSMLETRNTKLGTFKKFTDYLDTGKKPKEILTLQNEVYTILKYKEV